MKTTVPGFAVRALGLDPARVTTLVELEQVVGRPRASAAYLLLATRDADIPHPERIREFVLRWRLNGLADAMRVPRSRSIRRRMPAGGVRVTSKVVVDVTDTAASPYTTGIQRVAKETVRRWWADPVMDLDLVTWDYGGRALRTLTAEELDRVLGSESGRRTAPTEVVIPWRSRFVLPEISVAGPRTDRLRSIAESSESRTLSIGFDCIPITSAETAGAGMPGAFSRYLASIARFDRVAAISDAAAVEYRGWRRMLSGTGLEGPEVEAVPLPFLGSGDSDPIRDARVARELDLGSETLVLAVGSHEPRKNHLGLLNAAELAWRSGRQFTLVLVGGNAWNTESFDRLLVQLRRAGRRILTLSGVDDEVIWSLYDLARFTVFPSLNEGFGLPIVESLSRGTPVITSNFGSMRELGEGNGAVLVDPLDPDALAGAMVSLLDDELLGRLRDRTRDIPTSTWDDYAEAIGALALA